MLSTLLENQWYASVPKTLARTAAIAIAPSYCRVSAPSTCLCPRATPMTDGSLASYRKLSATSPIEEAARSRASAHLRRCHRPRGDRPARCCRPRCARRWGSARVSFNRPPYVSPAIQCFRVFGEAAATPAAPVGLAD